MADITELLACTAGGGQSAQEKLLSAVYGELHRIASFYMRREQRRDHTLQATALVNEAYLQLAGGRPGAWDNRGHFYSAAAHAMRQILVDHARSHRAEKRAGNLKRVGLDWALEKAGDAPSQILDIDAALQRLALLDQRQARVVELRFFGGLTVEETAKVEGISEKTVKRDWAMARAWLANELQL
jgi:RNA polymerase sigma factor (TIGR02999 family)